MYIISINIICIISMSPLVSLNSIHFFCAVIIFMTNKLTFRLLPGYLCGASFGSKL